MTHVATVTGTSKVIRTIDSKKLRKGKYYKFMVISVDSGDIIQSSSTIQHVATKGGKVGNYKSVKTRAKKNKVRLKEGKVFKLKARALKQSRKKIVRKHVAMRYESSNEMIAKVSSKGKIKAVSRGTCYVCAYAQNGVYKRIRVRVK